MAKEKGWHRRQAIVLASQLPDHQEDALLVLQAVTRLVLMPGFWEAPEPEKKPATVVRLIGGDECA